ncbi:sodium:calcium antiporter [Psychroflexus sediminis]|uniref:Cation:H+ antiporter n=1 Tax=Psychroflexus sediminis TaxID=470826 RepID=A0A1G7VFZ9_9FLAO|nr:sodium:calcium antiporter [Psychroflexus sediminis]SDG58674.1 cation:H+ antiporter [Psychroflexus sediminis]
MELLLYFVVVIVASLVVWKGGGILEKSAGVLAKYYELPPIVQGSIITAVGSSFPELSTTVISTLTHGQFDLGVSAIVGSAIFNILVIPGLSALLAGRLKLDRILVYKDAQFYIISVAVMLLVFCMAVIYNPIESENLQGTVTWGLALIPVFIYILYVFLQQQETSHFQNKSAEETTAKTDAATEEDLAYHSIWKTWLKFLGGLVLIVVSVEGLVRSAIFFGEYFGTPSFVWGATVLAAATSVPDAIVSVRVAINGQPKVSLSNVLGSNIFDLLIAIPAGILIARAAVINFEMAIPMMMYLTLATIVLFTFLRTGLHLEKWEGLVLLVLYLIFVLWIISESVGWLNYLPV